VSSDDELMAQARRLLEEMRELGLDLNPTTGELTGLPEIHAGDRVEATARWGVYVQRGAKGTVMLNQNSGEPNILWDQDKSIDYDLQTGTSGPFRVISAVERLGEVAS
jgi:hypothetical protein